MSALLADLRYAVRVMRKNPGFTTVAVVSLALGIGANTAIFSLVDAVLLRTLPVKDPHQLYAVGRNPAQPSPVWNYPDYAAMRDRNTGFSGLIAYSGIQPAGFTVGSPTDSRTEVALGVQVSGNYFQVLGVEPAAGRVLNPEDDRRPGAGPYIVLSHGFWRRRFGADPRVAGTTVRVNGYPFTIVGVAREGFTGIDTGVSPDFFAPLTMRTEITKRANWNNRNNWWIIVLGRLKPGASIPKLEAELYNIGRDMEAENRRTALDQRFVNRALEVKLLPAARGYSWFRNRLSKPLVVLLIVVGVVLLIACANVANLLLARAAGRKQEIAVRLAIGSGRARLVRQLLIESTLLAFLGGIAGLAFAYFGVRVLMALMPYSGWAPVSLQVNPDARVLGFTFAVCVATGTLFGLAPALQSTRPELVPALKQESGSTGTREGFRLRKSLVVLQVALSVVLLIGAGLFVRTLANLRNVDAGFHKERVLFVMVEPDRVGYKGQRLRSFYERLLERVEGLPGVRSAALARITPLGGSRWNDIVQVPGYQPKEKFESVDQNAVGPRFFETMGIPIVLGRDFRPEDSPAFSPDPVEHQQPGAPPRPEDIAGPRVAVVNESFQKEYFGGENPIGKRFSVGMKSTPEESFEIIGVVKDARYFGLRDATQPMCYQALWRPGASSRTLTLRTTGDPKLLIEAVRRELRALDATVPILQARSIEQQTDNNLLAERLIATLAGFFGLLAMLLAAVGLYGVMAQSVTGRTREMGIRMALGADRSSLLWMVQREALILVAIGTVIGVPAALAITKYAASFLYGVEARDPWVTAGATAFLAAVAMFASYVPARRASLLDPNRALRYE